MFCYNSYVRAKSLDEAYELIQKKNNFILGGMLWLKMKNVNMGTAVDLCDLGLNTITEDSDGYHIGAYVSLSAIEEHNALNEMTNGAIKEAVKHIVGTQFRNVATVGGSIWGRFGFSDVLTVFMVLDAKVKLHNAGIMPIEEFAKMDRSVRDILVEVIVPKCGKKVVYMSQRNSSTDFPTLTCAVSVGEEDVKVSIGARPHKAVLIENDAEIIKNPEEFSKWVESNMSFGSNYRADREYRSKICCVLAKRSAIRLLEEMEVQA